MKAYTKILAGVAVVLLGAAAMSPAQAACPGAPLLNTSGSGISVNGWPSAGATCYTYGCYEAPFSGDVSGVFWALNDGAGNNSGPFDVSQWLGLNDGGTGTYFYYPGGNIATNWNASAQITGCVYADNASPGGECTCILLGDQEGGRGLFALLGARMDGIGNTSFELPGGAPIILEELPVPTIVNSVRNGSTFNLDALEVRVDFPGGGVYQKDGCDCGPVSYKVVVNQQPRGNPAPVDRDSGFSPLNLQGGGMQGDTPIGSSVTLESMCGGANVDLWVAADVTFDSGFGPTVVSSNATKIECGPNLANPDRIKPNRPNQDLAPRGGRSRRSGGR